MKSPSLQYNGRFLAHLILQNIISNNTWPIEHTSAVPIYYRSIDVDVLMSKLELRYLKEY